MIRLIASVPPLETPEVSKSASTWGHAGGCGSAWRPLGWDSCGSCRVLDRNLARLRWRGVVNGAQLLIALPSQVHLICGIAEVEAVVDLGPLLVGDVFDAVPEEPADLIEGIVFVATAAQGALWHATSDLIDHLGAQPDHVAGVEDGDRIGQPVMNGIRNGSSACAPRRR